MYKDDIKIYVMNEKEWESVIQLNSSAKISEWNLRLKKLHVYNEKKGKEKNNWRNRTMK